MFSNKRIIAFVIYAICLLGIPAKMIVDQQGVFNEGTAYKFKCQPVDPNDPFRGLNFNYSNDSVSVFTLPFDRLYMNENKAQAAEDLYRNALRDTTQDVYAKVYITEGRFLLDDVYVDEIKLRDAIE